MCSGFMLSHQNNIQRPVEIKILILLFCYIVIWTDVIAVNTATLIEADEYRDALTDYFTCEAVGIGKCSRNIFQSFEIESKTVAYNLIGIYPAIFLIYFVGTRNCCTQHMQKRTAVNSSGTENSGDS